MGDTTAANLMHRLKAGELSHADFIEESETLPLEELQNLTGLLVEWAANARKNP